MTDVIVRSDGMGDYLTPGAAIAGICQKVKDMELPSVGVYDIICYDCISNANALTADWSTFDIENPPSGMYVEPETGNNVNMASFVGTFSLVFNVIGASIYTNRSVIWIRDSAVNFYGCVYGSKEIQVNFKRMIFYSRDGGTLVSAIDGVDFTFSNCNTAGHGTLGSVIEGTFEITSVTKHRDIGSGWHLWVLGRRDFCKQSGDYETFNIIVRLSRLGVIKTTKVYDIQNCLSASQGVDMLEESGPIGGHPQRRGYRTIGNILDRVRIHGTNTFRAFPLFIRHGGLYRRLIINNGIFPDAENRQHILGSDFWTFRTAIEVHGYPMHEVVIEKCLIVGFYVGIDVNCDYEINNRFYGKLTIKDNYYKYVDIGFRSSQATDSERADGLIGLDINNNRWFPSGYGNELFPPSSVSIQAFAADVSINMSCNNGRIFDEPKNCPPGGYLVPIDPPEPPSSNIEGPFPPYHGNTWYQPCDHQIILLAIAIKANTIIYLDSLIGIGRNHPGCSRYRIFQWNGNPYTTFDDDTTHEYIVDVIDSNGDLVNLPASITIPILYSGHIWIQFGGCEPYSYLPSTEDSGAWTLPLNLELPAEDSGAGIIPPEDVVVP